MKKIFHLFFLLAVFTGCITESVSHLGRIDGKMAHPLAYQLPSGEIWVKLEPDNSTGNYLIKQYPCAGAKYKVLPSCWARIPEDYKSFGHGCTWRVESTSEMPLITDAIKLSAVSINDSKNEKGKYIVYRESLGDYTTPSYLVALYDNPKGDLDNETVFAIKAPAPTLSKNSKQGYSFYRAVLYPPALVADTAIGIAGTVAGFATLLSYGVYQASINAYYDITGKRPETKIEYHKEDIIKKLQYNDGFCEDTNFYKKP